MKPSILDQLLELLETGRDNVANSVSSLSDADAAKRPALGRWSALECMEHIAFVEGVYLGWLESAVVLAEPKRDEEREAWITAHVRNRERLAQTPPMAEPKGNFTTVAEALTEFHAVRDRVLAAVRERDSKLVLLQANHPALGLLNGVELVRLIEAHASRHASQIRHAKESVRSS